jgi:hypothetical protein
VHPLGDRQRPLLDGGVDVLGVVLAVDQPALRFDGQQRDAGVHGSVAGARDRDGDPLAGDDPGRGVERGTAGDRPAGGRAERREQSASGGHRRGALAASGKRFGGRSTISRWS